jgi:hypothetical protein
MWRCGDVARASPLPRPTPTPMSHTRPQTRLSPATVDTRHLPPPPRDTAQAGKSAAPSRTSESCYLSKERVAWLHERIAALTGKPVACHEPAQVRGVA